MCAHFIIIPQDELERIIKDIQNAIKTGRQGDLESLYTHAYPKSSVPVLTRSGSGLEIQHMRWGYPSPWQKGVIYNAKMETALAEKPSMWDSSIRHRRCIIPSFGFFEPHMSSTHQSPKTGKPIKDQYFFKPPGSDIAWMAGIYEDDCFSVMTTAPNQWVKKIHPRMPVVMLPDELNTWLHGEYPTLANRDEIHLESRLVVSY